MATQSVFWICIVLAAAIFVVMVWSVATFKRDGATKRHNAVAAAYLHSRLVEVLWALIPIAIFVSAALPVQRMFADNSKPGADGTQLAAAD